MLPNATDLDQLMPSQDDLREQEKVEQVMAIMDQNDPEVARRVLKKWNGDVERTITAMLTGDIGTSETPSWPVAAEAELKYPPTRSQSRMGYLFRLLFLLTPPFSTASGTRWATVTCDRSHRGQRQRQRYPNRYPARYESLPGTCGCLWPKRACCRPKMGYGAIQCT